MKTLLLYFLFICTVFVANAQPGDNPQPNEAREQKIQALYAAYITQQLNLTPEEAQKFWPIHTQYDAEIRAIHRSDVPELDKEEAVLKVKRKYASNFVKILGADRADKFNIHDKAFRDKVKARLKDLKQKRHQMNDGNKPAPPNGDRPNRKRFN